MAIVDKVKQRFDENIKADKLGLINALIYASNNIDKFKPKLKIIDRDLTETEKIIIRLIPTLEIFRISGRLSAFGEDFETAFKKLSDTVTEEELKNSIKRLDSIKTAGGEMGIWEDSSFKLNKLAQEVADSQITIRRYFSVVFLNLFSFFETEDNGTVRYKHFLLEILKYIRINGVEKTYTKDTLVEIFEFLEEKDTVKLNNQRNILFDYLTLTEFFEIKDNENFKMQKYWSENVEKLIGYCNLEYKDSSLEEVREKLNRNSTEGRKNYSDYVTSNSDLLNIYSLDPEENNELIKKTIVGTNKMIFGAPGTGKSYNIKNFIKNNGLDDYSDKVNNPNVFRTTLHPEFSYSDFVGQVMPVVKEGNITYEFTPQVFTRALKRAFEVGDSKPVFLILEEMSRANVAAVFGDLFQILDRDENGESEYRIFNSLIANEVFKESENGQIYLPNNLFIIGTVNTSDQNVFVMDTAFKRRFNFEYISTKITDSMKNENNYILKLTDPDLTISWTELLTILNAFIVSPQEKNGLGLTEDKQLGHFFIKFKSIGEDTEEYNYEQIIGKFIQYLWNDIELTSYSNSKLFKDDINSFSELYEMAKTKRNFFSELFLSKLVINNQIISVENEEEN